MKLLPLAFLVVRGRDFCLPDALPEDRLQFVEVEGQRRPVGLLRGNWPSATISTDIFKILLREVMGYDTMEILAADPISGVIALAGCEPAQSPVDCGNHWSGAHVFLDFLETRANLASLKSLTAAFPASAPQDAGETGYSKFESAYVSRPVLQEGFQSSSCGLDYFGCYQRGSPHTFFESISSQILQDHMKPCSSPDHVYMMGTISDSYLRATNDADSIVPSSSTGRAIRCTLNFWISSACRSDVLKCVPLVVPSSEAEAADSYMQKAQLMNMPLAVGVLKASSNLDTLLQTTDKVLFHWSEPANGNVSTVVDALTGMQPARVILPREDPKEWQAGIKQTSAPHVKYRKLVHTSTKKTDSKVYELIRAFSLYQTDATGLVEKFAVNKSSEDVACDWVRNNEAVWRPWIPTVSKCDMGSGMYSSRLGTFTSLRSNTTGCKICSPGRFSEVFTDDVGISARCQDCPKGEFQAGTGETQCRTCGAGSFSDTTQSSECTLCAVGKFQVSSGRSVCLECAKQLTTSGLGSTLMADCICHAGYYRPCLDVNGDRRAGCICNASSYMPGPANVSGTASEECLPCADTLDCSAGSDERHLPCSTTGASEAAPGPYPAVKPGYYTRFGEPLNVFRCLHKAACPGGAPESCSPHMSGIACGLCDEGYYRLGGSCQKCSRFDSSSGMFPMAAYLFFMICFGLMYKHNLEPVPGWSSPWHVFCSLLFMFMTFWQIACVGLGLFPSLLHKLYELDANNLFISGMSLLQLRRFQCVPGVGGPDFLSGYRIPVMLPLGFIPVYLLASCCYLPVKRLRLEVTTICNIHGSCVKTLFATLALNALSFFHTYRHPNGSTSLTLYEHVLVGSDEQLALIPWVAVGLAINVVLPLAIAVSAVVCAPKAFRNAKFRSTFKFLFVNMRPSAWYFILVVLLQTVWIGLTPVLFEDVWRTTQWLMGGLVLYLFALLYQLPWSSLGVTILDALVHAVLLMACAMVPFILQGEVFSALDYWETPVVLLVLFYFMLFASISAICALAFVRLPPLRRKNLRRNQILCLQLCETFHSVTDEQAISEVLEDMSSVDAQILMRCVRLLQAEMFAMPFQGTGRLQFRSEGLLPRCKEDLTCLCQAERVNV